MHRRLLFMLLSVWAAATSASDLLPWAPTPSEMALLPDYCKVRATDDQRSPEFKSWMDRVGPKFLGIHHYCAGLNFINRYQYRVTDRNRNYYLSRAVPEIDYVAKDMPAGFPLAGEIYLNRGIALQLMKKEGEALLDFNRAVERDAKQVGAYLAIADIHEKRGTKVKALEVVSRGLTEVPGNKRLQRRYLALGGKEPFPGGTATRDEAMAETGSAKPESAATDAPVPGNAAVPAEKELPAPETGRAQESSEQSVTPVEETRPGIGSPTNPYCRFCP